jgi:Carboxypeptidase regulatory-like domain
LADLFGNAKDYGEGSSIYVTVCGRQDRRNVDCFHAVSLIKPEEGAKSLSLDLTVQAAHAVRGRVVGSDGRPLTGVRVGGLTAWGDTETLSGASFTIEGLNPRRPRELIFHHREKDLGKFATVRGDQAEGLEVRLEPCGVVTGRVVNKAGRPVPGASVGFFPGTLMNGMEVVAKTDREGRFRAELVAGQKYSLSSVPNLPRKVAAVEVESGQTKDLGDVLVN